MKNTEIYSNNDTAIKAEDIPIPEDIIKKWQNVVNILAKIIIVPAVLIMKVNLPYIEVLRSSETNNNPYKVGDKEHLNGSGLYCEAVIKTKQKLLIPNALKDKKWNKNPDIKLGMISYLGFPILYPNGNVFGTLCVLDSKENKYNKDIEDLMLQLKEIIESHLSLIYYNKIINDSEEKYKKLSNNLEKIVIERTKELKESETFYKSILDGIFNGVWVTNKDDIINYTNKGMENIAGIPAAKIVGARVLKDFPESTLKYFRPYYLKAKDMLIPIFYDAIPVVTPAARQSFQSGWLIPKTKDGIYDGIICTVDDITERKKAEEKLRESEEKYKRLSEELEQKVEERTKELKESEEKYRKAYEQINFYKDLFSHDINNIIQAINGSIELYIQHKSKLKELQLEDLIKRIELSSKQAIRLIFNVRKLSELEESFEKSLKEIDLIEVLNEAINNTHRSFQEKEIEIKTTESDKTIKIQANDFLLDVFENILNNSVKYNENLHIKIDVNISNVIFNKKSFIKMEFIDNGIGIPDDRKEIIFQKGFKSFKGVKGMGIGLSLVKMLVERYNGKIWVEDRVKGDYSKGSKFILMIPEMNS